MDEQKRVVAKELAKRVKSGDILGVGTGSTVNLAIEEIGRRIKSDKLRVSALTTSYQSAWKLEGVGIDVLHAEYSGVVTWGFDGADEVDPDLRLIKGRGGALLREKILASRCAEFIVIVDESKCVTKLGEKFPVPVECIPEARFPVERALQILGASTIALRKDDRIGSPVLTEMGNLLLDVSFSEIGGDLPLQLSALPGVVEHGIFVGFASEVLVASDKGLRTLVKNPG